jgi:hypothetical protein
VSTAGYVKLLLPPRQSRGNSHWGLGNAHLRCKSYIDDARTACGALFESEGDTDTPNGSMSVPARLGARRKHFLLSGCPGQTYPVVPSPMLCSRYLLGFRFTGATESYPGWGPHPGWGLSSG